MMQASFHYKDENAPKPNKPISIGTCIFIEYEDKILFEHRTDSDLWALIGGKLMLDESLAECIKREVKEETGISLFDEQINMFRIFDDPSRIASFPDGNVIRIVSVVYYAKLITLPILICSEESRELRFFSRDEIVDLNIAKTHLHVVKEYLTL